MGSWPAPRTRVIAWAAALSVLVAGVIVYRGALGTFFSSDDFRWLAGARGLAPLPDNLSRWIPYRVFWKLGSWAFGLDPRPYHAASLVAHLGASAMVFLLLRRYAGRAAAAVGAAFYATHATLFTSVYWISAIGDPLATCCAVGTLLLLGRPDGWRWLALPVFLVALSCKESVALIPLAGPLLRPADRPGWRNAARDPVLLGLLALSALAIVALVASDTLGLRRGGSEAYAAAFGPNVTDNLLTYAGWTLDAWVGTVRSFGNAVDPGVFGWGVAATGIGIAAAAWAPTRRRGALAGAAIFVAGLLPVLPLERHTYHYYLSSALAGAALVAAAAWGSLTSRLPAGAREGIAAGAVMLLAWNGATLVHKIEHHPFPIEGLRSNATVDRARIAEHVIHDLRGAGLPADVSLVLWSPTSRALERLRDSSRWSYGERNVRAALYDGLAVRLFFPRLHDVRFAPSFEPAGDSVWYGVYRVDGRLRAAPAPELARALAGEAAPAPAGDGSR